jgi:hypothetical protein
MTKAGYILIIILMFFYADGFSQSKKEKHKHVADTVSVDSIEYELIILDPGFESWLLTKPSKQYYSKEYYEYKNRLYVAEWNYRYSTIKNHGEYDSYIDYEPEIDYGLDLNYELYYYFKYFEETHGTKLYPTFR